MSGASAVFDVLNRATEAASPGWCAVAPADRARLLRRLAAVIDDHREELAQLETANVDKPMSSPAGSLD